jgi:chromosome segregation ATPase
MEARTLRELTAANMALLARLWETDGEIDEQLEAEIDNAQAKLSDKVDAYCNLMELIDADVERIKAKIDELSRVAKRLDNKKAHLKNALIEASIELGETKVSGSEYRIVRTANKRVIVEAEADELPEEYVTMEPKILKAEIKKALLAGKQIDGCGIEETAGLRISVARKI